jgi:hypothetical protein
MSYKVTRYFWSKGSPLIKHALDGPRFDTYEEALKAAMDAKPSHVGLETAQVYSETVEALAVITTKSTREVEVLQ